MLRILGASTIAFLFLLGGCTPFTPDLEETGVVKIVTKQGKKPPRITFVNAYRSSNETVIRGELKYPPWIWFGTFTGHVDVMIEAPDNKKVTLHDIAAIRKRIPKKRGREAFFIARTAMNFPTGSIITIEYSDERHQNRI